MVEENFGLKKRPFRATATGAEVFVGPQIAVTMAGLKKALAQSDAVTVASGPVGCGKTTIVGRTLESFGKNIVVIHVGRMRLDSDDVLELLLDKLEIENKPLGTVQRFTAFRRQLKLLEENGTRVFVTVEDGPYLGAETLAELEALTAADAGESEGASVVVMGDESLDATLREPQLVRLQQRIRQRYTIPALSAAELRGYLRHCFRIAGGDFEQIFEANAAALLHHLSDGIPRIANNIVASGMSAGAAQGLSQISSALLARVAENEFGRSAAGFDLDAKPIVVPQASTAAAPQPTPEPEPVAEADPVAAQPAPAAEVEAPEIPDLIQDTLPDLQTLAPELALSLAEPATSEAAARAPAAPTETAPDAPVADIEAITEVPLEIEPEATTAPEFAAESPGTDVPDWDRDPTMAELMPDLDALELALASSASSEPELPVLAVENTEPQRVEEKIDEIPEITLDMAISQRIESNLIDEPGEISPPGSDVSTAAEGPDIKLPLKSNNKADAEIDKIAAELSKAKSIEDVDDKMAETLFGDEINFVAAHVLANPPTGESANDDLLQPDAVAQGEPVLKSANGTDLEVTLGSPELPADGGIDLSASQRLRTVRALNATIHAPQQAPQPAKAIRPAAAPSKSPESIEDQINTSMTQTLKALNVPPPVIPADDDDDDEERKRGFFSRFKRS